jgi:hypothetical protein
MNVQSTTASQQQRQQQQQQEQPQSYTYGVSAPPKNTEVTIEERLYDVDEDDWQPSTWMLVVLAAVVVALAAGLGVGIYYANENKDKTPSPTSTPTISPTIAPTPVPPPFVCNVCGNDSGAATITIPNGIVNVDGEAFTCIDLQVQGLDGMFTESVCTDQIQTTETYEVCGCAVAPTTSPAVTQPPTVEGGGSIFRCLICGDVDQGISDPDAVIGELPGVSDGSLTCQELQDRATNGEVDRATCFDGPLTDAVQSACGCTFRCNLCGTSPDDPEAVGEITNPDGIVQLPLGQPPRSCATLQAAANQGSITAQQCELIQPYVVDPCECVFGGGSV